MTRGMGCGNASQKGLPVFVVGIVGLSFPQDSCKAPACGCEMEPAGTHVSHYSIEVWHKVAKLIWTGLQSHLGSEFV